MYKSILRTLLGNRVGECGVEFEEKLPDIFHGGQIMLYSCQQWESWERSLFIYDFGYHILSILYVTNILY